MRRKILVAAMIAAAIAAGPVGSAGADAGLIRISATKPFVSGSVALNAEVFRPRGDGPFPAVVLMHGCGGWQPAVRHSLQSHARFLRDQGYFVLSLDSFGPRGNTGGVVCESFDDLRRAREYRTYDAFDALAFLQARTDIDADRIFLMGQSNGGSVALKVAERGAADRYGRGRRYRGVVAMYPWCGALGTDRPELETPLLILGGGSDDWVPPDECTRFRATGAPLEVEVYSGVVHSFDVMAPVHRYLGSSSATTGMQPRTAAGACSRSSDRPRWRIRARF